MSSPCTAPRLVRCRMRDLASCFYPCHMPLDEEPDVFSGKPPKISEGTMVFNSKSDYIGQKGSGERPLNVKKMCNKDIGESVKRTLPRNTGKGGRAAEGRRQVEPRVSEEDYIVFRFSENGDIHMIGEAQSSEESYVEHRRPNIATAADATTFRPLNRKVRYGEGVGLAWDCRTGVMVNPDDNDIPLTANDFIISGVKKDDEKWGNHQMGREGTPYDSVEAFNHAGQPNASKMGGPLVEFCGSNLSDASSASSFAFPELGFDWIGSPVRLPKSE